MSLLSIFNRLGNIALAERDAEPCVKEHGEAREPVFQECIVTLQDFHKIRAVIVELGATSARIHYSDRTELPFRVRVSAPSLKLNCWARVIWQRNEAADVEFLPEIPIHE